MTAIAVSPARSSKSSKGIPALRQELEDRLIRWITSHERKGMLVGGTHIKLQALKIADSAIEFYCKGVGCEFLRFPTRGPLYYRFDSKEKRFSNLTSIT